MAISLVSLAAKRHTATVDIDGEPLVVEYKPYTIAERQRIIADHEAEGLDVASAYFLSSILVKWDLQGPDGEYPTDPESVLALPAEFVNDCLLGIGEARKSSRRS